MERKSCERKKSLNRSPKWPKWRRSLVFIIMPSIRPRVNICAKMILDIEHWLSSSRSNQRRAVVSPRISLRLSIRLQRLYRNEPPSRTRPSSWKRRWNDWESKLRINMKHECFPSPNSMATNQRTTKVEFLSRAIRSVDFLFAFLVSSDEKIIDYDPNDPNLVDEPYLDVENPYEGLGAGRPDPISRLLHPTAGRQSPDSLGQGRSLLNTCVAATLRSSSLYACLSPGISTLSAPPGYGEDYGTISRLYAPYGLNDDVDDYSLAKRSPSIDTEFRGRYLILLCFASLCFVFTLSLWSLSNAFSSALNRTTLAESWSRRSDRISLPHEWHDQRECRRVPPTSLLQRWQYQIENTLAEWHHLLDCAPQSREGRNTEECLWCAEKPLLWQTKRGEQAGTEESWWDSCTDPSVTPHTLRRCPWSGHCRPLERLIVTTVERSDSRWGLICPGEKYHHPILRLGRWHPSTSESPRQIPSCLQEHHGNLAVRSGRRLATWDCYFSVRFSNCSSADYDGRRKMRDCEGFVPSLFHAVNSSLQSLNEIDNKSIENCMCILRNLSYKLQEVMDRDYDRNYPSMRSVTPKKQEEKGITGCTSTKTKKSKSTAEQADYSTYAAMPPRQGRPVEMLWQPEVIATYVHLLRHSSNPDTLEATAGCIQNLSTLSPEWCFHYVALSFLAACYWKPSVDLRGEVRKARGLHELVDLLRVDECDSVVNAAAIALRNLAIDQQNCEALGSWAIKELVAVLPDSTEQTSTRRRHSDETIASVLAALNEIIRKNETNAKILYQEGGLTKMKSMMNAPAPLYNSKVIKYTAHVLSNMYKHRALHDFYKHNGHKENDFMHHRLLNSKSLASSPQSTLHRPRGDMGQPTHFTAKGKQITRPQSTIEMTWTPVSDVSFQERMSIECKSCIKAWTTNHEHTTMEWVPKESNRTHEVTFKAHLVINILPWEKRRVLVDPDIWT